MKALLKKSEIPEIIDLQEELNVPQTGEIDEQTLIALDQEIAKTKFAESEYIQEKLEKECDKDTDPQDFIRECAIIQILKYRYKCDMEKIEKFFRDCMRKKYEEDKGITVVEIAYDPENSGAQQYQQVFEQGGTIKTFQQGGTSRQVVTNEPRFSDVTVGELRAYASRINDKSIQRALKKGKLFDLEDDATIRLYDNNTFEVISGGPQIGIKQGEGALSTSNWFGKGNVRASNVIGNYIRGVKNWQSPEVETPVVDEKPEETSEVTYKDKAFTDADGNTYLIRLDPKTGESEDGSIKLVDGAYYRMNPETNRYELVRPSTKEEEEETKKNKKSTGTKAQKPKELKNVKAFQEWVLKNHKDSDLAEGIRTSGGTDNIYGSNTAAAWKEYADAYKKASAAATGSGYVSEDYKDKSDEEVDAEFKKVLAELQVMNQGGKFQKGGTLTRGQKIQLIQLAKEGKKREVLSLYNRYKKGNTTPTPKRRSADEVFAEMQQRNKPTAETLLPKLDSAIQELEPQVEAAWYDKGINTLKRLNPLSTDPQTFWKNIAKAGIVPGGSQVYDYLVSPLIDPDDKAGQLQAQLNQLVDLRKKVVDEKKKKELDLTIKELNEVLNQYNKSKGGTIFSKFRHGGKFIKAQTGTTIPNPQPLGLILDDVNKPLGFNPQQVVGEGINAVGFGISKPKQLPLKLQSPSQTKMLSDNVIDPNAVELEEGSANQVGNVGGAAQVGVDNAQGYTRKDPQLVRDISRFAGMLAQKRATLEKPKFQEQFIAAPRTIANQTPAIQSGVRTALRSSRNADLFTGIQASLAAQSNANKALAQEGAQRRAGILQEFNRVDQQLAQDQARRTDFENMLTQIDNQAAMANTTDKNRLIAEAATLAPSILMGTPEGRAKAAREAAYLEQGYQQGEMQRFLEKAQKESPELYANYNKAQNALYALPEDATQDQIDAAKEAFDLSKQAIRNLYKADPVAARVAALGRQEDYVSGKPAYMKQGGSIEPKDQMKHKRDMLKLALQKAKMNKKAVADQQKLLAENTKAINKSQEEVIKAIRKIISK